MLERYITARDDGELSKMKIFEAAAKGDRGFYRVLIQLSSLNLWKGDFRLPRNSYRGYGKGGREG